MPTNPPSSGPPPGRRHITPVAVVDDHSLLATSLVHALRGHGFDARAVPVGSVADILTGLGREPIGLVLLDLDLGTDPDGRPINGADLIDPLRADGWQTLILSGTTDRPKIAAAIAAGALGWVPKSAPMPELIRTITDTATGRPVMSAAERRHWLEVHRRSRTASNHAQRLLDRLTSRERDVLAMLADGHRVTAIAARSTVAEATVRTQVRSILKKLEVNSQLEAVALYRTPT